RAPGTGPGAAGPRLTDAAQSGRDGPHLACPERACRDRLRTEVAQLQELALCLGGHESDALVVVEGSVGEPDVRDNALVGVIVAVEYERLERYRCIAAGRGHASHDRFEDLVDTDPLLGRCQDGLLAGDGEGLLELAQDHVRIRAG